MRLRMKPTPYTRHTPISDLPELLTVDEFMAVTGIRRTHAYDLVRSGEVSALKWGKCYRIPRSVLQPEKV
jgi:excisionase family DNA binding protein